MFVFSDPAGVPNTAGASVSFEIEIGSGATSGEIIFNFYDVDDPTITVDYIYPNAGQTLYTVQAPNTNSGNLKGLAAYKNYGDVTGGPTIVGFNIL